MDSSCRGQEQHYYLHANNSSTLKVDIYIYIFICIYGFVYVSRLGAVAIWGRALEGLRKNFSLFFSFSFRFRCNSRFFCGVNISLFFFLFLFFFFCLYLLSESCCSCAVFLGGYLHLHFSCFSNPSHCLPFARRTHIRVCIGTAHFLIHQYLFFFFLDWLFVCFEKTKR